MVWTFRTGGWTASSPSYHDGKVFIGSSDGNLYCLDFETGKEIWRFETEGNILNKLPFPVVDGVIYFGSDDSNVYGVRIEDGKEVWRFRTGRYVNARPVISDGVIYFLSSDTNFYAVDIETRKEIWRFRTGHDNGGSSATLFDDKIIFGSSDENFYCLNTKDGKEVWRFKTFGGVWSRPLVEGDRIYFGSYDCHLYCLNLNGELVWKFKTSNSTQNRFDLEEQSVFEFNPPEIEHEGENKDDRYAVKTEVIVDDNYRVKSEYQMDVQYQTKGEYK